jgi:hypothetical protein
MFRKVKAAVFHSKTPSTPRLPAQPSSSSTLCRIQWLCLLLAASLGYAVFWAGLIRKLPHPINPLTACEAQSRFDPSKIFLAGYTSTARRLAADSSFVEVSGPLAAKADWTLCKWAHVDKMTPFYNQADAQDPMHRSTSTMLDMLDALSAEVGTVTVARSGVALGVYRDQRRLTCDSDLDLWLVAKDEDLHAVYEALRRIVPKYGGGNYTLADLETFSSIYYDRRMALGRIEHAVDGNKVDFELVTAGFTQDPTLNQAYLDRCGVSVAGLFGKLCWSRHGGRTTSVAAFSDMPTYLAAMYGPGYGSPVLGHYAQRCTIQVHTPRDFLRWWPLRLLRGWLELQPAIDLVDPLDSQH